MGRVEGACGWKRWGQIIVETGFPMGSEEALFGNSRKLNVRVPATAGSDRDIEASDSIHHGRKALKMAETKRERPAGLDTLSLPGPQPGGQGHPVEGLVGDVRRGVEQRRYLRGMIFPEVAVVERLYGLSEKEVRSAIRRLRDEELLQLHDDYQETYFIDLGRGTPIRESADVGLVAQVAELTTRLQELSSRVQALESVVLGRDDR